MKAVYVIAEEGSALVKIGYASSLRSRLSNMQSGHARHLTIVFSVLCERPDAVEKCAHELLAEQRHRGEWYSATEEQARAAIMFAIAKLRVRFSYNPELATQRKPIPVQPDERGAHRWYVREWLAFRGMSQEDLARAVGVDGGDVSKWIRGKRRYNEDVLNAFAEALDVTPAQLLGTDPRTMKNDEEVA